MFHIAIFGCNCKEPYDSVTLRGIRQTVAEWKIIGICVIQEARQLSASLIRTRLLKRVTSILWGEGTWPWEGEKKKKTKNLEWESLLLALA